MAVGHSVTIILEQEHTANPSTAFGLVKAQSSGTGLKHLSEMNRDDVFRLAFKNYTNH